MSVTSITKDYGFFFFKWLKSEFLPVIQLGEMSGHITCETSKPKERPGQADSPGISDLSSGIH